jgi:hemerythrin
MLEWKSEYETGMLTIDTQHRMLFNNINLLEALLNKEEFERSEADYLLKFLERYAEQHFKGEESCMARFRCPAYAKNKEEHADFLNILRFAKGQYEISTTPKEVLERLHESMVWWIHNHILKVDMQLRDCAGVAVSGN